MKSYIVVKKSIVFGLFFVLMSASITFSIVANPPQQGDQNDMNGNRDDNFNITFVGSTDTTFPAKDLAIQGGYAYVASRIYTQSCPPYSGAVDVIDINFNPEQPFIEGTSDDFERLTAVDVKDDYAYVIDIVDMDHYLKQIFIVNPSNPFVNQGNFRLIETNPMTETKIAIQDQFLYAYYGSGVRVYQLSGMDTMGSCSLDSTVANDIFVFGDYAYIVGNNQGMFRPKEFLIIVNIVDPLAPEVISQIELGSPNVVSGISVIEHQGSQFAFLSALDGLWIIDVTDPYNPSDPISIDLTYSTYSIYIENEYAFLSAIHNGIFTLDISDPLMPEVSGYYDTDGNASALFVVGNNIYVADDESGFLILKFTGVAGPVTPQQPSGPNTGEPDVTYIFTLDISNYPPDEEFYFWWDWGDGSNSGWQGPFIYDPENPSEMLLESNSWSQGGEYSIKVKAKNSEELESDWSEPHIITIINDPPDQPTLPSGPSEGYRYKPYEFSTTASDPNNDEIYYQWNFGGDLSNWFGPYKQNEIVNTSYIWLEVGIFDITVRAKDIHEEIGPWSDPHSIGITNRAPATPDVPTGPTSGDVDVEYTFSTVSTDEDDDLLYYLWDWGDGTFSEWDGPYASGEESTASHTWETGGTFPIRVKAKDQLDLESDWSDPLEFFIGEAVLQGSFLGGLGLDLIIENVGDASAEDVGYTVEFEGGFILAPSGGINEGTVFGTIAPDEQAAVDIFVLGLGLPTITGTLTIDGVIMDTFTVKSLVLGPIVIILGEV